MSPLLAGCAENAVQARLLRLLSLLRDEGSLSRVDLTERPSWTA